MATRRQPPAEPAPPPDQADITYLDDAELAALPRPTNVIEALARVEREIKGIRKLTPQQRAAISGVRSDERGVNFAYRGIDQIASLAQPLFGEYGIVMVPQVLDVDVDPILKGDRHTLDTTPWTRTTVKVKFDIYGPGGINDFITSTVIGVGDDNSDKGINKAMTAAFKNVLLRVLCIGDPQDDTDQYQRRPEDADDRPPHDPTPVGPAPDDPIVVLFNRVKGYGGSPVQDDLRAAAERHKVKLTEKWLKENEAFRAEITEILDGADARQVAEEQDAAAEAPQEPVASEDGAA